MLHIYQIDKPLFNCMMQLTIDDIRRLNMLMLLEQSGDMKRVMAEKAGTSPSYISQLLTTNTEKRREIGDELARRLEDAYGKGFGWMDQYHADVDNNGFNSDIFLDNNVSEGPELRGKVPLISSVPAGDFKEAIDNLHPGDFERMVDVSVPVGPHTFALRVDGDSMEPEFRHGDIVIVEPDFIAGHGNFVIAKNGGNATFKQLWMEAGDWYLKPLNDRYPIKPLGDSVIIGVVREKTKRYI